MRAVLVGNGATALRAAVVITSVGDVAVGVVGVSEADTVSDGVAVNASVSVSVGNSVASGAEVGTNNVGVNTSVGVQVELAVAVSLGRIITAVGGSRIRWSVPITWLLEHRHTEATIRTIEKTNIRQPRCPAARRKRQYESVRLLRNNRSAAKIPTNATTRSSIAATGAVAWNCSISISKIIPRGVAQGRSKVVNAVTGIEISRYNYKILRTPEYEVFQESVEFRDLSLRIHS
jgi:hypothetical protein